MRCCRRSSSMRSGCDDQARCWCAQVARREQMLAGGAVEAGAHRPQRGKELLVDRSGKVLGTKRPARSTRERPEHALDELHMLESPLSELLLVLEERLREKEHRRRTLTEIQRLQLDALCREKAQVQVLER